MQKLIYYKWQLFNSLSEFCFVENIWTKSLNSLGQFHKVVRKILDSVTRAISHRTCTWNTFIGSKFDLCLLYTLGKTSKKKKCKFCDILQIGWGGPGLKTHFKKNRNCDKVVGGGRWKETLSQFSYAKYLSLYML